MNDEDQCADSMENVVAPDSLMIEDNVDTLDINTEVLDVADIIGNAEDATFEDIAADSLDDIVLDSDEEGSELVGSVGMPVLKGKRRNVTNALKEEEKKLSGLGNLFRSVRKISGHIPSSLSSSRSRFDGDHTKVMQHEPTSDKVDTMNLGISKFSDQGICQPEQGVSDHSNLRKVDTEIKRQIRSVTNDAFCQDKSSSSRNETRIDARKDPSSPSHHDTTGISSADYSESWEASEVSALDFVDRFLSTNSMDFTEKFGSGRVNRKNPPPSVTSKGAQTLARKADASLRHVGVFDFDWPEEQTCKKYFVKQLDEHIVELSQHPLEKAEAGLNPPETYDVGFDTQIAAEAMEDLMYSSPPRLEHAPQVPQIKIHSSSDCALKTSKYEVCCNLAMIGSDSPTIRKQKENVNSNANHLDGKASCSSIKLSGNRRGPPKFTCREPLSESTSDSRLPFSKKGKMTGKYAMVKCKQRKNGTQEGLNSVEACGGISLTKSVKCKRDDPMKFSKVENREINEMNLRSSVRFNCPVSDFKRRKRSKVDYSNRFKDPICVFKRRKSCKVESDIPDTKRAQRIREESSKIGSQYSKKITGVKETKQAEINSDYSGLSHLLKSDPWNHPKGKRTRKFLPQSDESIKSSALSTLVIEREDKYHCKNSKTVKRRRVPSEDSDATIQSVLGRPPSPTILNSKTAGNCLPGFCVSGFMNSNIPEVPVESDRGCSSNQSAKSECRNTTSSVGNTENVEFCSVKRFNDPICVFKRRKRCKVDFDIPENKREQGSREESSKLGSKESTVNTSVKETKQAEIDSDRSDLSHLLRVDPSNHPKGKRTRASVQFLSDGSIKSYSLPTLAIEGAIEYQCKNSKTIKGRRIPSEDNDATIQSVSGKPPSPTILKSKTSGNCLPGVVSVDIDRGCSSNQSAQFECRGSASSIGNIEHGTLDPARHENEEPEICNQSMICKKTRKPILSNTSMTKELTRLGYGNLLPDFVPRESRRHNRGKVRVLFSQHLDPNIVKQQKKIITRLDFSVASCCSEATHFISDRFVRTRNMLEAIACGKAVVTHFWLESCCQANSYINEESFILRDAQKEKELGFTMPVSLALATQHPLLQNKKVYVTPNVRPDNDLIQCLVKAVHGKVVGKNHRVRTKEEDVLILSSANDYASCVNFLERGAAVYDSELLLTGIIIQKLEYERHRLFTSQVEF